jgi:hypothetical protein
VSVLEVLAFVMGAGSKTPGTGLVLPCKALAHKPSYLFPTNRVETSPSKKTFYSEVTALSSVYI